MRNMATHVYELPLATPVKIRRASLEDISRAMQKLLDCDPWEAVYFRGKMISPTLPSAFMTF